MLQQPERVHKGIRKGILRFRCGAAISEKSINLNLKKVRHMLHRSAHAAVTLKP